MFTRTILILSLIILLAGCGGGGSSPSSSPQQEAEKAWVRSYLDDVYLWYNEIVDVSAGNYPLPADYFKALLVKSRDRYSFTAPRAEVESVMKEGVDVGYGVKWGWAGGSHLFAFYVDPNAPAALYFSRGAELIAVNGTTIASLSSNALNSALFPSQSGASVNLTIRMPNTSTTKIVTLTSAQFSIATIEQPQILTVSGVGKVGYLLFNEHLRTSEQPLINAMAYFKQQGVNELVLDMRYNSGGYLIIAEEVASMIGGAPVQGKVFDRLIFNAKHQSNTNDPNNTALFTNQDSSGNTIPQLGLPRLFVLTGASTCSASEAIINGLLPHINVTRIGWTTCGKPYGFRQTNYGANAYFAIEAEGVNANGTDDYKSGFAPTCQVSDDIRYPLGNTSEARLSAALYFMQYGSCPTAASIPLPKLRSAETESYGEPQLLGQRPGVTIVE